MARKISASVGRMGGVNRYKDVVTVQELLNQVPITSGGPSPPLKIDGICGPKTIKGIQVFQIKHFGWSGADGRVDPDGPTHLWLNTFDKSGGGSQPGSPPPQTLPKSNRFVIHRMASRTTFAPYDRALFFQIIDMTHGLIGIYWLQMQGRRMTTQKPPSTFASPSRSFLTSRPYAIDSLTCPAMYSSRQASGRLSSSMALFLIPPVQINDMPHHLIGPGGQVGPGRSDASTAIAGTLQFVKQG
jgi:hypothetical protein